MKWQKVIKPTLVIGTFLIAFFGRKLLSNYIEIAFPSTLAETVYSYLWWVIPTFFVLGYLFGFENIAKEVGINKGFLTALLFSAVTVAPMFISSAIIGHIDEHLKIGPLIHTTIVAGFMEEYFFRSFLFGILFRHFGWGFIPAAVLAALIFGLGHIYQGATFIETTSIFFVTASGAIWFSWLFIEWNENLWIPILLHTTMNLSWILFNVSDNALGALYTNFFRILTIALTIFITIHFHKEKGLKINKTNLIRTRAS